MSKRTQKKLSGKVGTCPEHFSECKYGRKHLGGKAARRAAKVLGTDPVIWIEGASDREISLRLKSVDEYLGRGQL
jgi:hypothetical protein